MGRNPKNDAWLKALAKHKWSLRITEVNRIKLNPAVMNYVDGKRGYNFLAELEKRSD